MKMIIRFLEQDVDGCGTDVDCLIEVDLGNERLDLDDCEKKLAKAVQDAKNEIEEWTTDDILRESMKKVFGDARYDGVYPDIEVVF